MRHPTYACVFCGCMSCPCIVQLQKHKEFNYKINGMRSMPHALLRSFYNNSFLMHAKNLPTEQCRVLNNSLNAPI